MGNIIKYRTELMGISILWIMLFHAQVEIASSLMPLKFIKSIGYTGVDIFFLLSGIGLMFSMSKNNSCKNFYIKRLIRIIPTFWLCIIIWGIKHYILGELSYNWFFLALTGTDFWVYGNLEMWFIPAILLCYLIFPAYFISSHKFGAGKVFVAASAASFAAVFFAMEASLNYLLIFIIRMPVFFMGAYIGALLIRDRNKNVFPEVLWNSKAVSVVFLILSTILMAVILLTTEDSYRWETGLWWYPSILMAYPLIMVISFLLSFVEILTDILTNSMKWLGSISLEIYLVHNIVFSLSDHMLFQGQSWNIARAPEYVIYFILSLIGAWLVNYAISPINERLENYGLGRERGN